MTATETGVRASEVVTLLPRTLRWDTEGQEFPDAELRHARRVGAALSTMLERLRTESPSLADGLVDRLSQVSESTVSRVLLSPNASRRLLWEQDRVVDNGHFLEGCLRLEAAAPGAEPVGSHGMPSMWSALGDAVVRAGGEVIRWDPVEGSLAVDLESPDAAAPGSTPLAPGEQRTAVEALTAAHRIVHNTGSSVRALIGSCARVVVLRKQQTTEFCSFSSCDYIGRLTLVNPHLVDELIIADALVHESIHSYLYMDKPRYLWGLAPEVREEPGVVISPWSGRTLPVCAYLHACFVWYGLFFFWCRVMACGRVPAEDARRMVIRAGSGFLKGALLGHLGPERTGLIQDDVQAALAEAQRNVLAVVAK